MEVTNRQRRLRAFAAVKHTLRTQENIGDAVRAGSVSSEVRYGFCRSQKLQTRCDSKLYDFIKAVSRRKLGGIVGRYKTRFKLEIRHWSQCCGSRDGGTTGICIWFLSAFRLGRCGLKSEDQQ